MLRRLSDRVRWWLFHAPGTAERSHLPYFPHEFDAPSDVLRGLRDVDRTADLLYVGWGQWTLVSVRPQEAKMITARRRLRESERLLHRWDTDPMLKRNPGAFRRLYQRKLYWLSTAQGARPIAKYDAGFVRRFGLEAIIADFRRMDWMHRTATEQQVFDDNNATFGLGYERERARREADGELRSEYRALDAWRYLAHRTHSVTRHDDPDKRRHRSGFTPVAAIGADGQLKRLG